jgi:hypothetical protein
VLALAAVAFGMTWALRRPWGTFSLNSLHFWADEALAPAMWVVVALAAGCARTGRTGWLAALVAVPPGGFIGAALFGTSRFSTTTRSLWGALFLVAALWLLASARLLLSSRLTVLGLLLGMAGGALHLAARVPPPAQTHGSGEPLPEPADLKGVLNLPCGRATLVVHPLLELEATSRDGFWPGLSTTDPLEGAPGLSGPERRAFLTHGPDWLEALTVLPREVASHLNRFTDLRITGASHLRIAFEGQPAPLDFLPFDYPRGRVAWFAYVSGSQLVVAHGSSAEKGPFVRVASLPLDGERLGFTLFDGEEPLCSVAFLDFVRQADAVNESPTAGEGVPPNVIQFGIPANGPGVPVMHLSLAETGIGAGRDTIRHAAGNYRNRIRITQHSGGAAR